LAPPSSTIPVFFVIQPIVVEYRKEYITVILWSLRCWRWRWQNLHRELFLEAYHLLSG
ncbi:hypothetical protein BC826DRAFT_1048241, partial [Russula brevipes]